MSTRLLPQGSGRVVFYGGNRFDRPQPSCGAGIAVARIYLMRIHSSTAGAFVLLCQKVGIWELK